MRWSRLFTAWNSRKTARQRSSQTRRPATLRVEHLEDRWTPTVLPTNFTETLITSQSDLSGPTAMEFSPTGQLFALEQTGSVKLVRTDTGTTHTALTLTVDSAGERGLLGIAFDPSYDGAGPNTDRVFLYYTTPRTSSTNPSHNRLSRFTVTGAGTTTPTLGSEVVLYELPPENEDNNLATDGDTNHNGGALHVGPDGKLYVAVGDHNYDTTPQSNHVSQTLTTPFGKILRLNLDGSIPTDNPFFNTATGNNRAAWALGLRNPYTFAFQPGTGRMFINDVGESAWEEINDGIAAANYGWAGSTSPLWEGFESPPPSWANYRDPIMAFDHSSASGAPAGCAITGGVFYPASGSFPSAYAGKYFFADVCGNFIRVFDPANPGSLSNPDTSTAFASSLSTGGPVDLKVDAAGNLYYLARGGTGEVYRISYQAPTPTATATFVQADNATSGSWIGKYGNEGYRLAQGPTNLPAYAQVSLMNNLDFTWAAATNDPRALQKPGAADRLASTWFAGTTFTIDLNLTDGQAHAVSLYLLDWDNYNGGRNERIEVLDAGNGQVLDTHTANAFTNGRYLTWTISGHVQFRVTNLNPNPNAVVSALFVGQTTPAPASATFVQADNATSGNWQGVYGPDGYRIAQGASSLPAYAQVNLIGNLDYVWAGSTTDTRALRKPGSTDRLASTWFAGNTFTIDVNLTDSQSHRVALYLLDWDNYNGGRNERVEVLDAGTGSVLDTRTASAFTGGRYLVWTMTGHVQLRITNLNPNPNAVASGLFFG